VSRASRDSLETTPAITSDLYSNVLVIAGLASSRVPADWPALSPAHSIAGPPRSSRSSCASWC